MTWSDSMVFGIGVLWGITIMGIALIPFDRGDDPTTRRWAGWILAIGTVLMLIVLPFAY